LPHIPEEYIADLDTRLHLYQRLAKIDSPDEVEQIAEEFKDRFGDLPPEVSNLLYIVNIKALAAKVGVHSVSREDGQIIIRLKEGVKIDRDRLGQTWQGLKVSTSQLRLDIRLIGSKWQQILEEVTRELGKSLCEVV